MTQWILGGLVLGFAGSLHCVGMCGPLVLALPGKHEVFWKFLSLRISYNVGRALTYTWMGLLLGIFGRGLQLSGLQEIVSLAMGILLLAWVIVPRLPGLNRLPHISFGWLTSLFGDVFYKARPGSQLLTGMLNGLLPCGLVYMAIATALLIGNPTDAAVFMASFGLGTIPALLTVAILDRKVLPGLTPLFKRFSHVLVLMLAVIFILRGLGLGIPYLSPDNSGFYTEEAAPTCH
ncbi:MAG: sulfite exporter TauE/SafE family protein [Bacteroidia bacterium]